MTNLRAYELHIKDIEYVEWSDNEIGTYYERADFWEIVYAETPSKAKHQFIKHWRKELRADIDYTSPIKVRLLAKNVIDAGESSEDFETADWLKATLTPYGQSIADRWAKDVTLMEQIEADYEAQP